jgi:hypothetical protein
MLVGSQQSFFSINHGLCAKSFLLALWAAWGDTQPSLREGADALQRSHKVLVFIRRREGFEMKRQQKRFQLSLDAASVSRARICFPLMAAVGWFVFCSAESQAQTNSFLGQFGGTPSNNVTWGYATKWSLGVVPNAVGAIAQIGSGSSSYSVVLADSSGLDASFTIGRLNLVPLNQANVYSRGVVNVAGGTGKLTFDVSSGSARVDGSNTNAFDSTKTVAVGVLLNDPLEIMNSTPSTLPSGQTMTFTKPIENGTSSNGISILANTANTGSYVSSNVTFQGVNTYTGDTTISGTNALNQQGRLVLSSTSETRFLLQDSNISNRILGSNALNTYQGQVTLDGLLRVDASNVTASEGTWNLVAVDTLNASFGGTFGLAFVGGPTFANAGGGSYTATTDAGDWTFSTATGNLVLVPEPAALALTGVGFAAAAWGVRRITRRNRE